MAHSTDILLKILDQDIQSGRHSGHKSDLHEKMSREAKPKQDRPREMKKEEPKAERKPVQKKKEEKRSIPDIGSFVKSINGDKIRGVEDKIGSALDSKFKRKS